MGDDFQKVHSGLKLPGIPVPVWNEMLDALAWVKQQRNRGGGDRGQRWQNTGIVNVKNTTGAALDRFSVVGIDTASVFPDPGDNLRGFKNGPILRGVTPDTDTHLGAFAVLQSPLGVNKIGPAVASGVTVCKVTLDGSTGDYVDIIDGDSGSLGLVSGGSARVLWVDEDPGSGEPSWAVVRIGGGGGNGGVQIIRFTIVELQCYACSEDFVDPEFLYQTVATGQVRAWPPGTSLASVPDSFMSTVTFPTTGAQSVRCVSLMDLAGCWLNGSEDELRWRTGWAVYLDAERGLGCEYGEIVDQGSGGDTIVPRWEIISLCPREATCGTAYGTG